MKQQPIKINFLFKKKVCEVIKKICSWLHCSSVISCSKVLYYVLVIKAPFCEQSWKFSTEGHVSNLTSCFVVIGIYFTKSISEILQKDFEKPTVEYLTGIKRNISKDKRSRTVLLITVFFQEIINYFNVYVKSRINITLLIY